MISSSQMHDDQREVIAFLMDAATFDPRPASVRRIDTHGAHVFIGERDVFKIKRAVRYPYMDFSTLALRRAACAREIEVNRANAPQIYKGLVRITREADQTLALGGRGEPIEWAVHMARFPEEDVLANRVAREPLTRAEAAALADAVAASHGRAAIVMEPKAQSAIEAIATDVLSALDGLFPSERALILELRNRLARSADAIKPLLAQRVREGYVRRCHGDLHLGNIVLIDGVPTLFDAIEFDEALASVDIFYDLAFLLMDLEHRGQRATANAVLNRYLWRRQDAADLDALAALPVFLSLRAAIRAMVGAQRSLKTAENDEGAKGYLARAVDSLRERPGELIVIGGLSGTGKSTLGAALAPLIGRRPGALHVRSDLERKAIFRAEEFERLPPAAYAAQSTARVYQQMLSKCEAALRAGHSVIADAVHADPSERDAIAALAQRNGAHLTALWLKAPLDVLKARVVARKSDASDATPQVVDQQMTYDLGELEWTRIDASGTPEETLCMAMSHLHASIDPR